MRIRIALLLTTALAVLRVAAFAQETNSNNKTAVSTNDTTAKSSEPIKVTATEAKEHIGANAIVTGTVAEVNKAASLVRLNFENPFPKNVFTAVIFARSTNQFPEVDKFKGKKVEVTGKIADFRGHPEIIVNSTNQIKLVEKPAEKKKD